MVRKYCWVWRPLVLYCLWLQSLLCVWEPMELIRECDGKPILFCEIETRFYNKAEKGETWSVEILYGWVRNITGYFLFLAVLDNLIPEKKYEKYIRLFAGMVTILLVIQPLTGALRLEEQIARFYKTLVFQYQAEDLRQEMLGVEEQRFEQMIGQYEEAVAKDVRQMAEELGFIVIQCQAEIGKEHGSQGFGTVAGVWIQVSADDGEKSTGAENGQEEEEEEKISLEENRIVTETIKAIDPVVIGEEDPVKSSGKAKDPAVEKLRRKIVSYYDLEDAYVEIQVVEREG
ncbi:hypothetical protein D3Z55_16475 [Clostridiaceae bacterium]|nr:hypothetical protein [Clostridiaceae bacterium]